MTADHWVDLIIRRGAELRAAGVLRISAEGCSAVIAPQLPELDQADNKTLPIAELDPLDDPMTFGGGQVPGYHISDRRDDSTEADA